MRVGRGLGLACLAAVSLVLACTKVNPHYCTKNIDNDCDKELRDAASEVAPDAEGDADAADASDGVEAGDAAEEHMDAVPEERPMCTNAMCSGMTPICDVDAGVCESCGDAAECVAKSNNLTRACDTTGACVECLMNTDCTGDATKPICDAKVCRGCKADTECPAPGICLDDGSCAPEAHVVHLDSSAAICPGDGSAATPFCSPTDATGALMSPKTILVVHGPNAAVTISTLLPSVVVVGKPNAAAEAAAFSVGVGAGLTVSNGTVLARDLSAIAGTSSGSKGFFVTGAGAKLTLLRVTSALGTGLGVDAEIGSTLAMDRCIVQNDSVGGLLVNSATAKVTNSVFANNGYGVKFNLPLALTTFESNTVVGNSGNAATCDSAHMQPLVGSIIVGFVDTCVPTDSLMTAPPFDAMRPFHLTAHDPCPMGDPANMMFPPDDIDGDPRTTGIDCGADQYVAK